MRERQNYQMNRVWVQDEALAIIKDVAQTDPWYEDDYWHERCPYCRGDVRPVDGEYKFIHTDNCAHLRAVKLMEQINAVQAEADSAEEGFSG